MAGTQTRAARVAPRNPVSSHRAAVSDPGLDLGGRAAQYRPGIAELERRFAGRARRLAIGAPAQARHGGSAARVVSRA